MSKKIKQMEMDALKQTFRDVRDMVLLTVSKVDAQTDNQTRLALRKKNIRLQMVKNSLARRVFGELGLKVDGVWEGPTVLAWGAASIAELSREIDALLKKNKNIQVKKAIAEGQELPFERARTMPTREEAIATILGMILSPAAQIAGQIQTIGEKKPEEAAAPAAG